MSAQKKQKSNSGAAIARGNDDDTFEHVVDEVIETGATFRKLAFRDVSETTNNDLKALAHLSQVDSLDVSGTKVSSVGFSGFMKQYTQGGGVGIRKLVVFSRGNAASDRLTPRYLQDIVARCGATLTELHISIPAKMSNLHLLSQLSECKTMNLFFKGMRSFTFPPLQQVTNLTIELYSITYLTWAAVARTAAVGGFENVESLTLKCNLISGHSFELLNVDLLRSIVSPMAALRFLNIPTRSRLATHGIDAVVEISDKCGIDRHNLRLWAPVPLVNAKEEGADADA